MEKTETWPSKQPGEALDFSIDWVDRLDGDTIATSDWSLSPSGLTQPRAPAFNGTIATVWIGGGVDGTVYRCENTITTAGGRTMIEVRNLLIQRAQP